MNTSLTLNLSVPDETMYQKGAFHGTAIIRNWTHRSFGLLSSSFSRNDFAIILSTPDRDTTAGKREYAIPHLASATEMRAIDIASLKLSDINWEQQTIHHKYATR